MKNSIIALIIILIFSSCKEKIKNEKKEPCFSYMEKVWKDNFENDHKKYQQYYKDMKLAFPNNKRIQVIPELNMEVPKFKNCSEKVNWYNDACTKMLENRKQFYETTNNRQDDLNAFNIYLKTYEIVGSSHGELDDLIEPDDED